MTRRLRWAILAGSGVALGAVGYIAGGDSSGTLFAFLGLIGGPLIVGRLLSIGQTVSDHVRAVDESLPGRRRLSPSDAELMVASDPVTRDLVPELLEILPAKLHDGERLVDASVAKAFGGPGLLAVTDRRVVFLGRADPDQPHEIAYRDMRSLAEAEAGELVALTFLRGSGDVLMEAEVSPQNAVRIAVHVRGRISTPPFTPGPPD